jgi:hypothetical protein
MGIKGIGRKPVTRMNRGRPLSLGLPAEARRALRAMGHTWDVDARIIGSLIRGLQDAGTWDKYRAVYPFYPGRAASNNNHRWNLKDPQDTNGAFRITWSGTVSHTANGVSSATGGYGNTNLTPSTAGMSASSATLAVYTTPDPGSNTVAMGAITGSIEWAVAAENTSFFPAIVSDGAYPFVAVGAGGYYVATRTDATTIRGYQNGSETVNSAQGSTGVPTSPLFILGQSDGGAPRANGITVPVRYGAIASGLTAAEVAADEAVVRAYQESLGRAL